MVKVDDKSLHKLLKDVFGFESFKGNQEAIIKSILSGNNTFVLLPTGGGKSLCYQLPALLCKGTTIVVSPLIALMKNQVDMIRNFGADTGIAHVMNSSLSKAELMQVKQDLVSGKTKLLYVAPESLTKEDTVEFLRSLKISSIKTYHQCHQSETPGNCSYRNSNGQGSERHFEESRDYRRQDI